MAEFHFSCLKMFGLKLSALVVNLLTDLCTVYISLQN